MNGLVKIQKILLPLKHIEIIYEHLRSVGHNGVEGIALLLGKFEDEEKFIITASLIPKQEAYRTESGLFYYVGGEELHRINRWAYENKLSLIAQIHSHPGEAYHSSLDDAYAIMSIVGGFSIVIPNFAFGPIDIKLWETYRLSPSSEWKHVAYKEVQKLFEIIQ